MLNGIKVVMEEGTEVIRNSLGIIVGSRGYNGMAERGSYTSQKPHVGTHILGTEKRKWWKQPSNAEYLGIFHIHTREGGPRDCCHGSQLI